MAVRTCSVDAIFTAHQANADLELQQRVSALPFPCVSFLRLFCCQIAPDRPALTADRARPRSCADPPFGLDCVAVCGVLRAQQQQEGPAHGAPFAFPYIRFAGCDAKPLVPRASPGCLTVRCKIHQSCD